MIILWTSEFDGLQIITQLLACALLLFSLLPGCLVLMMGHRSVRSSQMSCGNWLSSVVVHVTAWILLLFSLTLGPSAGMTPDPGIATVHSNMEDMLREASQVVDLRHLFGRGGVIGDLQFAGFRNLEVQGNVEEPLFAFKRRYATIPLAVFMLFHLSVYVCAVLTVLAIASFSGAKPLRLLWFSLAWGVLVYAPAAHWIWGEGWLGIRGVMDEGGSLFILIVSASTIGISRYCPREASDRNLDFTETESSRLIQHVAAIGFVLGYLLLMSSMRVPVSQVRTVAILNGILSACGGFLSYSILRFLFPGQAKLQSAVTGLCCGVIAVAAGATMYDPRTALTCGVIGGVTGFSTWSTVKHWKVSSSLEFAVATSAAASIGLLLVGICGTSATGVKHWNRDVVNSLMHGETTLLKYQALAITATVAYVLIVSGVLGKVWLRSERESSLKTGL